MTRIRFEGRRRIGRPLSPAPRAPLGLVVSVRNLSPAAAPPPNWGQLLTHSAICCPQLRVFGLLDTAVDVAGEPAPVATVGRRLVVPRPAAELGRPGSRGTPARSRPRCSSRTGRTGRPARRSAGPAAGAPRPSRVAGDELDGDAGRRRRRRCRCRPRRRRPATVSPSNTYSTRRSRRRRRPAAASTSRRASSRMCQMATSASGRAAHESGGGGGGYGVAERAGDDRDLVGARRRRLDPRDVAVPEHREVRVDELVVGRQVQPDLEELERVRRLAVEQREHLGVHDARARR